MASGIWGVQRRRFADNRILSPTLKIKLSIIERKPTKKSSLHSLSVMQLNTIHNTFGAKTHCVPTGRKSFF